LPAVRAFLALGGTVATLGIAILVWGVRQQVAWSECQVRCIGHNPWPVTALGIALMAGGGFLAVWTAASDHSARVLRMDMTGDPPRPNPPRRAGRELPEDG
jgi:hypothetical protein